MRGSTTTAVSAASLVLGAVVLAVVVAPGTYGSFSSATSVSPATVTTGTPSLAITAGTPVTPAGVYPGGPADLIAVRTVTNGGAFASLGERIVSATLFTPEEVARLRDYLASTGLHGYFQSYDGLFASEGLAELLAERFTAAGFPSKSFHDDAQVDDTLIAKLVFLTDDEDAAARALTELAEDFEVVGGTIPVAFAASGEVAPRGVHKGAAIQALLRELDLDPDDAVGIGDNWNDAEMFAVVGTSIAMGNAVDGVKALADQVTTAIDEDGLRTAFRRNGLI